MKGGDEFVVRPKEIKAQSLRLSGAIANPSGVWLKQSKPHDANAYTHTHTK